MNWQLLLPLLVTSIVTMLGWFTVHNFARKRDFENKKKELRINYLIEVWRKLNHVSNRNKVDNEGKEKIITLIEQIITDIQLFGSRKQIELAKNILDRLKGNTIINLDDLLDELRRSLRDELGLEAVDGKVHFFRLND